MITELDKHEFHKVKHITDECSNIEVRAITSGLNPGRIYVNDATNITAALIWVQGHSGFQLVGDPQSESFLNGLEEFMMEHIEPDLLSLHINAVEIGVVDERWEDVIHHIAAKREVSSDIQHVFGMSPEHGRTEPLSHRVHPSQVEAVRVLRINEAFLKGDKFNNLSFLEDKISRFWRTTDDFLQHGFGYIAVHHNDIASVCFSAFISDQIRCMPLILKR